MTAQYEETQDYVHITVTDDTREKFKAAVACLPETITADELMVFFGGVINNYELDPMAAIEIFKLSALAVVSRLELEREAEAEPVQ